MARRIQPPECLLATWRALFPQLDWRRIRFHVGMPALAISKGRGFTYGTLGDINIYIKDDVYKACSTELFIVGAHELVHAEQIQAMSGSGWIPGSWASTYIACVVGGGLSTHCDNDLEREAYGYADGCGGSPTAADGRLAFEISQDDFLKCGPCLCKNCPWAIPRVFGGADQPPVETYQDRLVRLKPDLVRHGSSASLSDCLFKLFPITLLIYLLSFVLFAFLDIFGAVLGFFEDLVNGISDFFTGGGSHPLHLKFSVDGGVSFDSFTAQRFEKSSEPPCLAVFGDSVFIVWTTASNRVGIMKLPSGSPDIAGTPLPFGQSSDDSGPAIAAGTLLGNSDPIWIAWIAEDQHILIASSHDGTTFKTPIRFGHRASGDSSPSLAIGNGQIYLSWVDDDNNIHLLVSRDGINWGQRVDIGEKSVTEGMPALAFGSNKLFLAWTGTDDDNRVNVIALDPQSPTLSRLYKTTLRETSSDDAGPSLAFSRDFLYLAWTGSDDRVYVTASSDEGHTFQTKRQFEAISDDAGPALAAGVCSLDGQREISYLALAWVGRD